MPDNPGFKEQIKKLIQLQQWDTEIFDLQAEKESYPVRIEEMDIILETKKSGMNAAEDELKTLRVSKNEKENEMQTKEERISKLQGDLYQIKNNKEYQALQQEIDSIKADVSLIEEEIINFLDKIEAAQAKVETEKKGFEGERQTSEKEKEAIKAKEKEITDRLNGLRAEREKFVTEIDANIRVRYERILENRGRVALARINGDICGECNLTLRPQIINEAQLKQNLVFCENCARMLYVED